MLIKNLYVQNFRNLLNLKLSPAERFNVIYGQNGSGKTSILEAICYLALGRSFRKARHIHLISYDKREFVLSANIRDDVSHHEDRIGVLRSREHGNDRRVHINQLSTDKLSDLADYLCVQLIHPLASELILEGPDERRGYIDWGVYYSNPEFKGAWLQYRRVLYQRNILLKNKASKAQILAWNEVLVSLSEKISTLRDQYLNCLIPYLNDQVEKFLPDFSFNFSIYPGWDRQLSLSEVLSNNLDKDQSLGYTYYGCHRADLKIRDSHFLVSEILSRGQLKLLVCAMRLAQSKLLLEQTNKRCVFLIDDLSSELDSRSRNVLLEELLNCGNQVFITCISPDFVLLNDKTVEPLMIRINSGKAEVQDK